MSEAYSSCSVSDVIRYEITQHQRVEKCTEISVKVFWSQNSVGNMTKQNCRLRSHVRDTDIYVTSAAYHHSTDGSCWHLSVYVKYMHQCHVWLRTTFVYIYMTLTAELTAFLQRQLLTVAAPTNQRRLQSWRHRNTLGLAGDVTDSQLSARHHSSRPAIAHSHVTHSYSDHTTSCVLLLQPKGVPRQDRRPRAVGGGVLGELAFRHVLPFL